MRLLSFSSSVLALAGATSIPIDGYTVAVTTSTGKKVQMQLDTYLWTTSVPPEFADTHFTMGAGVSWEDDKVESETPWGPVTSASLGLAPSSAFMAAHGVVTINPKQGKMVVGEFDPSDMCKEGQMTYTAQTWDLDQWLVSVEWNSGSFGDSVEPFIIDYRTDSDIKTIVPPPLRDSYYSFFAERVSAYAAEGKTYTVEIARTEVPVIHLKAGDMDVSLTPEEYVVEGPGGPKTIFTDNQMILALFNPFVLDRFVVQLDRTNNRAGICTPL